MALKALIRKCSLNISDMDRYYYHTHEFTLAQHPSETDLRLMVRILAYALNAEEGLEFTKGLSTTDEPDLWKKDLVDHIEHWIELGQVDEKRIRQACHKADKVTLYTYQDNAADVWQSQVRKALIEYKNLSIYHIPESQCMALESLIDRGMSLFVTIQDEAITMSNDTNNIEITPQKITA